MYLKLIERAPERASRAAETILRELMPAAPVR
jgi:hypothetical protein